MQRLYALLVLYRQLWLFTNSISLLMWLLAGSPTSSFEKFATFLAAFFWLRTLCQLLVWYLFRKTNQKGFVFYHHFGLSEIQLAGGIYIFDLLLFTLWILFVSLIAG